MFPKGAHGVCMMFLSILNGLHVPKKKSKKQHKEGRYNHMSIQLKKKPTTQLKWV
jgi:hypothetical protein